MAQQEPIRKRPGGPRPTREIPDKLYFRIGEVAKLCEVPAYVLRFWEGEFPQLKPNKGGSGQRLYRRRDVEMALRIKTLLYDEGYTIAGARQAFKSELRATQNPQLGIDGIAQTLDVSHMQAIQKELRDLLTLLSRPASSRQPVQTPVQSIRAPRPVAAASAQAAAVPAAPKPLPAPTPFPKPARKPPLLLDSLFEDLPPDA